MQGNDNMRLLRVRTCEPRGSPEDDQPWSQDNLRPDRSRPPTKKRQKRPNPSNIQRNGQNAENTIRVAHDDTMPKRVIVRSQGALDALDANTQMTNDGQTMKIVDDSE